MSASTEDGAPWTHRVRSPAALAASLVAAILILILFLGTLGARRTVTAAFPEDVDPALALARREAKALRMELALASAQGVYLVLDLDGHTLTLKRQGAPLRGYLLTASSVRTRRVSRLTGGSPSPVDTTWGPGVLLPPIRSKRTVILADTVSPPDPSGTVAVIPPTPEEAVPTPPDFRIVYPGGFSIRVRAEGDDKGGVSLPGRLAHWVRGKPWQRDRSQLELTLTVQEAGALYRSLPPGAPLMVLGPGPVPAGENPDEG